MSLTARPIVWSETFIVHGVAILTGPLTSVKEQATGAWASALAERGFGALSFDHRYYDMARAVTAELLFCAFAGIAVCYAHATEQCCAGYSPSK